MKITFVEKYRIGTEVLQAVFHLQKEYFLLSMADAKTSPKSASDSRGPSRVVEEMLQQGLQWQGEITKITHTYTHTHTWKNEQKHFLLVQLHLRLYFCSTMETHRFILCLII